jgi:hypothetical protein
MPVEIVCIQYGLPYSLVILLFLLLSLSFNSWHFQDLQDWKSRL